MVRAVFLNGTLQAWTELTSTCTSGGPFNSQYCIILAWDPLNIYRISQKDPMDPGRAGFLYNALVGVPYSVWSSGEYISRCSRGVSTLEDGQNCVQWTNQSHDGRTLTISLYISLIQSPLTSRSNSNPAGATLKLFPLRSTSSQIVSNVPTLFHCYDQGWRPSL